MPERDQEIAQSIVQAIVEPPTPQSGFHKLPRFFSKHWLDFKRIQHDTFETLRALWHISEEDYRSSFVVAEHDNGNVLRPIGDMGLSGSTFYTTSDSKYLIKSVPRNFEYTFFRDDLLEPYALHMQNNTASLLVRITDFLESSQSTIGTTFGLAPSHHIVMENIRYGQDSSQGNTSEESPKWESYDLKPLSYFYPERDVANGAFATEDALGKLADKFDGKLLLSLDEGEDFKAQLEKDTALLARCNAVDYSLFLIRIPASSLEHESHGPQPCSDVVPIPPAEPPFAPPGPPSWRIGIRSADGQWLYRAAILDFFWAKHKARAKMMTGLINTYNFVDRQGPMSITTSSAEYRDRFLTMCKDMIQTTTD